jgi:hemolysin III
MYSALTHGIGAFLATAAVGVLVTLAAFAGAKYVVSYSVYGASLIGLYTASTLYHCIPAKPHGRYALRKLDHIMIFFLIAGTYTPVCLLALKGAWGWSIFGVIWGLAVAGSIIKLFWLKAPRWISAATYIGMGWMVLLCIVPIVHSLYSLELFWLALGGVFYTVGGVLYALRWPGKENRFFGFHEVFHILIMFGSVSHYALMICMISRGFNS